MGCWPSPSLGGLRGRKGWFAREAEKEEREKAERAYGTIRDAAIALKTAFSVLVDDMRPQEERYRRRIAIEVPGLSPAAAAALTTIARTPDTDPRVLDAVVAKAVRDVRAAGRDRGVRERRHAPVRGEQVRSGSGPRTVAGAHAGGAGDPVGGRVVASCLAEGSLDHLIAGSCATSWISRSMCRSSRRWGRDETSIVARLRCRTLVARGGRAASPARRWPRRSPGSPPISLHRHRRSSRGSARGPVAPRKPFLAAYPYDAAAIDAALDRRVDPERDLKQDLDMLRYEIRRAVKEPAGLFGRSTPSFARP